MPKLFLRNAEAFKSRPAYRHKDFGIWQTWTWSEVAAEVRDFAIGLAELGVKRGDRVAIVGSNRPRLYWTFTAAQSLGAVPVPVYQDAVAEEMAYVLDHAEATLAVVEDQEQVDKVLSIGDRVPKLKAIVYDQPRGLQKYDPTHLKSFEDVQEIGRKSAKDEGWWREQIAAGSGTDISVTLYTSGTTGTSKGVLLSAQGCIDAASDTVKFDKLNETDEALAYLPLAWVGDHYLNERLRVVEIMVT
ncbi:MAG: AMP-binding protein, partial [Pseudomonadota bacterium]